MYYPKQEVPIWMIFRYNFAEEKEEAIDKLSVDLTWGYF